jgi:hypothetical protein
MQNGSNGSRSDWRNHTIDGKSIDTQPAGRGLAGCATKPIRSNGVIKVMIHEKRVTSLEFIPKYSNPPSKTNLRTISSTIHSMGARSSVKILGIYKIISKFADAVFIVYKQWMDRSKLFQNIQIISEIPIEVGKRWQRS